MRRAKENTKFAKFLDMHDKGEETQQQKKCPTIFQIYDLT